MSIKADSIQFFVQNRHSVTIRKHAIKSFSVREPPTPLEELTALLQIRWSTGIKCYTPFPLTVFLPLDAFGVLVIGGPKN